MNCRDIWIVTLLFGLFYGVTATNKCISRGKFPNNIDDECRGYTTCIAAGISMSLSCPVGFVYNHLDNQCTNSTQTYRCYPNYNCTKVGNYENPESTDCSSYIACVEGLEEIVTARLLECPPNTVFNPVESLCVVQADFQCISNIENIEFAKEVAVAADPTSTTDATEVKISSSTKNHGTSLYSMDMMLCFLFIYSVVTKY